MDRKEAEKRAQDIFDEVRATYLKAAFGPLTENYFTTALRNVSKKAQPVVKAAGKAVAGMALNLALPGFGGAIVALATEALKKMAAKNVEKNLKELDGAFTSIKAQAAYKTVSGCSATLATLVTKYDKFAESYLRFQAWQKEAIEKKKGPLWINGPEDYHRVADNIFALTRDYCSVRHDVHFAFLLLKEMNDGFTEIDAYWTKDLMADGRKALADHMAPMDIAKAFDDDLDRRAKQFAAAKATELANLAKEEEAKYAQFSKEIEAYEKEEEAKAKKDADEVAKFIEEEDKKK